MSPILEFRRATKTFRGIPAIKDIDFTLGAGEIHAIVGENGAGKSTLMKVLAGVYELTSGELASLRSTDTLASFHIDPATGKLKHRSTVALPKGEAAGVVGGNPLQGTTVSLLKEDRGPSYVGVGGHRPR